LSIIRFRESCTIADFSSEKVDSIKAITPLYKIEVVDSNGDSKKVNFLRKKKDFLDIDEVTGEITNFFLIFE
jgi:hypothetical protein